MQVKLRKMIRLSKYEPLGLEHHDRREMQYGKHIHIPRQQHQMHPAPKDELSTNEASP